MTTTQALTPERVVLDKLAPRQMRTLHRAISGGRRRQVARSANLRGRKRALSIAYAPAHGGRLESLHQTIF